MKPDYNQLFSEMRDRQEQHRLTRTCCRCGKETMNAPVCDLNAESRYKNLAICAFCGDDEAMREHEGKGPLPFYRWHFISETLRGKTFHDRLKRGEDFDCGIAIGGVDTPAAFVWNSEQRMTVEGEAYYADILQAPYELDANGNIEVFCDDEELGEDFSLSLAGYTANSRHIRFFCSEEIDPQALELLSLEYVDGGVQAEFRIEADLSDRCGIDRISGTEYSLLATYAPDAPVIRGELLYTADGQAQKSTTFHPTADEASMIHRLMEDNCRRFYGCRLHAYVESGGTPAETDEIVIDGGIAPKPSMLYAMVESWGALEARLPVSPDPANPDTICRCLVEYDTSTGDVRYLYSEIPPDDDEILTPVELTEGEKDLLLSALWNYCQNHHGCTLEELAERGH